MTLEYLISEIKNFEEELKEINTAKKVELSAHSDYDDHKRRYQCPICGIALITKPAEEVGEEKHYINYCHFCGQKLEWSE